MARLSLSLLGPPLIELDGQPVKLGRHKAVALLAYLALTRHSHARDALATMLWPDLDQSAARAQLRGTLSMLNQALGSERLVADRDTVEWAPEAQVSLDVDEFRRCLAICAAHGHGPQEACAECVPSLTHAVELYRDGFLAGFTLPDAPAFDEWQFFEGEGLRDALAGALQRLVRWHGTQGEHESAIPYTRRWLALDPVHEPAHRALMELYARSGQRAAALRQYAECERVLKEELDAEPAPETVELYEAIRSGADRPGGERIPSLADLTGLPSPRPAPAPAPKHNLPSWLTPFVGREDLLGEIRERLGDPDCRLLTLVGPGGSGKTRLAVEAARAFLPAPSPSSLRGTYVPAAFQPSLFPHGVWFVSLAAIQSVEAMVPAIAAAIGFSFHREGELQRQLLDYLRQKRMLLLLDNCERLFVEHLLSGVDLVTDILRAAPGIKALVTSRERLNVGGEQLLPVPGMSYPDLTPGLSPGGRREKQTFEVWETSKVSSYSAVQLFLQEARQADPKGFGAAYPPTPLGSENLEHVVRICRLVEGMPLALLLAAAWVPVLSPAEIAAEIERSLDFLATEQRDLPERQRSMRAVFDYSWRLLSEREQLAFAALTVFRGGFTRKAAEQVAGTDLRALASLVNKSFITPTTVEPDRRGLGDRRSLHGRYQVHELLRQYGEEKLLANPPSLRRVHDRHCEHYAAAVQRWGEELKGPQQQAALAEMDVEIGNVRTAWAWATSQGQTERLAQMAHGLGTYYSLRSRSLEGEPAFRTAAERVLSLGQSSPLHLRLAARLLAWQGIFSFSLGHPDAADRIFDQSASLLASPQLAGQDLRAERALLLGFQAERVGDKDVPACMDMSEQELALYRELGDAWGARHALGNLGIGAFIASDYRQAKKWFEELLVLSRSSGSNEGVSEALLWLTFIAKHQGDSETAVRLATELVGPCPGQERQPWSGAVAWAWGSVLMALGRYIEAAAMWQRAVEIGIEEAWGQAYRPLCWQIQVMVHLGQYAEARALADEQLAQARLQGASGFAACTLVALGRAAIAEGTHLQARQVLEESLSAFRQSRMFRDWHGQALAAMAYLHRESGQRADAWACVCEALQIGQETSGIDSVLFALPIAALLLADQGDLERAVELYALAWRFPVVSCSRWCQDVFGKPLTAMAAALPPEVVAAAQARGRALDLQATLRELLEELS